MYVWSNAAHLLSDNYFVGPCPPIIITPPYNDPPPSRSQLFAYIKTLVAKQLPTNTHTHTHTQMRKHTNTHTRAHTKIHTFPVVKRPPTTSYQLTLSIAPPIKVL